MNIFWLLRGGGPFFAKQQVMVDIFWVVVDIFWLWWWVVVGGGGDILAGSGWWWTYFGWCWVVAQFSLTQK